MSDVNKGDSMSDLFDYIEILKKKRSMSGAELAEIVGITPVKMSRLKNEKKKTSIDIKFINSIERGMRLTESEKSELEKAYITYKHGDKKCHSFVQIQEIIKNFDRIRDGSLYNKRYFEESFMKDILKGNLKINKTCYNLKTIVDKSVNEKFFTLTKNRDLIDSVIYLLSNSDNKVIKILSCGYDDEINEIIKNVAKLYPINQIDEIIYTSSTDLEISGKYAISLLKSILEFAVYNDKISILLGNKGFEIFNGYSWMIINDHFIRYKNGINKIMYSKDLEFVNFHDNIFEELKEQCVFLLRKTEDGVSYWQINRYMKKGRNCKILAYEPLIGPGLNYEILNNHLIIGDVDAKEQIINKTIEEMFVNDSIKSENTAIHDEYAGENEVFFCLDGLLKFMNYGVLEEFSKSNCTSLTIRERCNVLQRIIEMSSSGEIVHYMLRDSDIWDTEGIHILYMDEGNEKHIVKVEYSLFRGGVEKIVLDYQKLVENFEYFFDVLSTDKYSYGKLVTIKILKEIVLYYKKEYRDRLDENCEIDTKNDMDLKLILNRVMK